MSLFKSSRILKQTLTAASSSQCRMTLSTGVVRMGGASRHDDDPEVLEKGKQSILSEHRKGSQETPRWHEEIASDAEAYVKAQRDEIEATGEEIAKLRERTKEMAKK